MCIALTGISATTCTLGAGRVWFVTSSKRELQEEAYFQQLCLLGSIETIDNASIESTSICYA